MTRGTKLNYLLFSLIPFGASVCNFSIQKNFFILSRSLIPLKVVFNYFDDFLQSSCILIAWWEVNRACIWCHSYDYSYVCYTTVLFHRRIGSPQVNCVVGFAVGHSKRWYILPQWSCGGTSMLFPCVSYNTIREHWPMIQKQQKLCKIFPEPTV